MLCCNVAKTHWYNMGRHLYYHLLDGDLASNFLSWQWVAGTSSSKRYIANQSLINNCTPITQHDSYLATPIEDIGVGDIPDPLLAHEPFRYTTTYPESDVIESYSGQTVFLYHPWSLDPLWRKHESGMRILVIEPTLFDRFPVSPLVMDFIIRVAKTHIPNIKLFIGAVEAIPDIRNTQTIISKQHPTTKHWPGLHEKTNELFPSVTGYYTSFYSFWQACLKTLH
jgi:deoxyribodipyrimidine photo-lyase